MIHKELLLERLTQIADSLRKTPHALALLGLGSAGIEIYRMDEYSDLDFFLICQEGYKIRFLENTDWLENIYPVSYKFKNTKDGYKLLFEDGVFCEFAVFEPYELKDIFFSRGRIIWRTEDFDSSLCTPRNKPKDRNQDLEWLLGEALTNLYVGLCRYNRGEKLSALNLIQANAMERVLELIPLLETPTEVPEDIFSLQRRFEFRYPTSSLMLSKMLTGYDHIPKSAEAILEFLDSNFSVNVAMKNRILELCRGK